MFVIQSMSVRLDRPTKKTVGRTSLSAIDGNGQCFEVSISYGLGMDKLEGASLDDDIITLAHDWVRVRRAAPLEEGR